MTFALGEGSPLAFSEMAKTDRAALAKKRILVSVPSGFQVRQFIHSGVLDSLLRHGSEVLLLGPNQQGEGFASELPSAGVKIRSLAIASGRVHRRYWMARQHLLLSGSPTETLRQKMIDFRRRYFFVATAAQIGNRLLRSLPRLRKHVLDWEHVILRDQGLDELLATEAVDLILIGSPGYMVQDACLLHAAVRRGIPVITAIISWDNLSSKGVVNPRPDYALVWSEHMRQEAIAIQGMAAERILETGSLVHDAFAKAARYGSRAENLRHLGLDPQRRLIFYGTNHIGALPNEIEIVQRIARWVEEDAFGIPCQLWVRLHPQAVSGPYAVPAEPYKKLASDRVKVEFPSLYESNLLWDFPKADLEHLVRLLRDADVVINIASTLALDAAILDRPVVAVAYDPGGDLPYDQSIRRYYDWTHMANVVRAQAMQLARSPEELQQKIDAYLRDPALDRAGRQRIVKQQFGQVDGASAERAVDAIAHVLKHDRRNRN